MLIRIDIKPDSETLADPDFWLAFENLLLAHREGYHVIVASPPMLDTALQVESLPTRAKGILRNIRSNYAFLGGLHRTCTHYISVQEQDGELESSEHGNLRFRVSWKRYTPLRASRETYLVVESAADHKLLAKVMPLWLPTRTIGRIAFEPAEGGGSQIGVVARGRYCPGRPMLIVADSDKRWPKDTPKATAKHALAAGQEHPGPCTVHVIQAREMENLLHPAVFMAACPPSDARHQSPLPYANMSQEPDSPYRYLDLKTGLTHCEFKTVEASAPAFSRCLLSELPSALVTGLQEPEAPCSPKCKLQLLPPLPDIATIVERLDGPLARPIRQALRQHPPKGDTLMGTLRSFTLSLGPQLL